MSTVQSVFFPIGDWSPAAARMWLAKHSLKPIKESVEGHYYHFRIRRPSFHHYATKIVFHHARAGSLPIHLIIGFREPGIFR